MGPGVTKGRESDTSCVARGGGEQGIWGGGERVGGCKLVPVPLVRRVGSALAAESPTPLCLLGLDNSLREASQEKNQGLRRDLSS